MMAQRQAQQGQPGGVNSQQINTLDNRVGWRSIGGLGTRALRNTGTILLQIP